MSNLNQFNQIIGSGVDDWKPSTFPDRKSDIVGSNVYLVVYNEDKHAELLFEAINFNNDGSSWTYLPYGPFSDLVEFKKSMSTVSSAADVVSYTVFDRNTNKPVGTCSYLRIIPDHGSIEIGHIHFSALMKRSTASTESIYLLIRNAFDNLGYRRAEWKCDSLNGPSKSAALRFGFTFEGIFRQHMVYKGRNRDTAWLSITDGEWSDRKARFERWLHSTNFDSDGKQIKKLTEI